MYIDMDGVKRLKINQSQPLLSNRIAALGLAHRFYAI